MNESAPYGSKVGIIDNRDCGETMKAQYELRVLALQEAVRQLQALVAKQEEEAKELHEKIRQLISKYETPMRNRIAVQLEMPL